ncbi:MAG: SrtB family sortase, partial [Eggerthella lenta]
LVHVAADDPLAQTQFTDEAERVAYVQDKIDRSVVAASDIPEAADIAHTFALATCDNLPSDGRYVLYSYVAASTVGEDGGDVVDPEAAAAVDSAEQEIAS